MLSEIKREKIRKLFEQGENISSIARAVNADRKTVRIILEAPVQPKEEIKADEAPPTQPVEPTPPVSTSQTDDPNEKIKDMKIMPGKIPISEDKINQIRDLNKQGLTVREINKQTGVSVGSISKYTTQEKVKKFVDNHKEVIADKTRFRIDSEDNLIERQTPQKSEKKIQVQIIEDSFELKICRWDEISSGLFLYYSELKKEGNSKILQKIKKLKQREKE